jgi:hypothetical protein
MQCRLNNTLSDSDCSNVPVIRLARVVAWLEALAGDSLDRTEAAAVRAGGSGSRFARGEGLPLETRLRLDQRPPLGGRATTDTEALVTRLDPDAPTRHAHFIYPHGDACLQVGI